MIKGVPTMKKILLFSICAILLSGILLWGLGFGRMNLSPSQPLYVDPDVGDVSLVVTYVGDNHVSFSVINHTSYQLGLPMGQGVFPLLLKLNFTTAQRGKKLSLPRQQGMNPFRCRELSSGLILSVTLLTTAYTCRPFFLCVLGCIGCGLMFGERNICPIRLLSVAAYHRCGYILPPLDTPW